MPTIFTQNDNFDHFEWNRCHFLRLLSLQQHLFSSQLEISHVLNGTTPKIQHRIENLRIIFLSITKHENKVHLYPRARKEED